MTKTRQALSFVPPRWLIVVPAALAGLSALAQGADAGASPGLASQPSPYYLGVGQGFTYSSNVYRIPFGVSDAYSSTSLLAGFDQPISRQRLFGTASVSLNRYKNETALDNTSYSLATGLDWATIWRLAGNVTTTLDQRLVAPAANVAAPVASRNLERRKGLSGLARWGGDAAITVESRLGYSTLDYSAPEYVASESKNETGSLGVFYQPGSRTRLGIAVRLDRTRTPQAVKLADGSFQSNEIRGRNLDLLGDYNNGNSITAGARLSYTRQTNTSIGNADFSGLTGSVNVSYRATGKISLNLAAARDAGFNSTTGAYSTVAAVPAPGTTPTASGIAVTSPGAFLYENNQVTNSLSLGATYAATAKISLSAGGRYSRAKVVSSSAVTNASSQARPDVIDESRSASLSANYAYSRSLTFICLLSRERREVSGAFGYGYTADLANCAGQFTWR